MLNPIGKINMMNPARVPSVLYVGLMLMPLFYSGRYQLFENYIPKIVMFYF